MAEKTYLIDAIALGLSAIGTGAFCAGLQKDRRSWRVAGMGICAAAVIVALPNALWCLIHLS